jgi:DNA-binding NarL/FixJ family response regulator
VAEPESIQVALAASGEDAERWRAWLREAGMRVTLCPDARAVARLVQRPAVVVLDGAAEPAWDRVAESLPAGVAVIVLEAGGSSRLTPRSPHLALPRSASRAALAGAVLAMSAGLRVERPGLAGVPPGPWTTAPAPAVVYDPAEDDEQGAWSPEAPTPRERDVLGLAALGLTNRAIAGRLGMSEHTVKFHLASVYAKLGARGRTQAVRRALQRGWIAI